MALIDAREIPADQTSTERLAESGLDYRVVDVSDPVRSRAYHRAVSRGFLGAEPKDEELAFQRPTFESRRISGVYETDAPAEAFPVATIDSWVTPMTVPGGEVDMWAISAVTVAATHRRRGIARALLEGELRAAASAGCALAGLTVTETTIYGRYGFGAAVPMMSVVVDTRRAGWARPAPVGTIEYVDRETLASELGAVHERSRGARSGRIAGWPGRWAGYSGLSPSESDRDKVRGVRYRDESGEVRGALAFALAQRGDTFRFGLEVRHLAAETPEALAALWRFALQHDLVDEVTADLRPVDDPLPWLVADPRGVTQTVHDHGWLRVLDVAAALTARRYNTSFDAVIRVNDALGFTAGDWRLRVDGDGHAQVERADGETPSATMDVAVLSALYAGGVRAGTLHAAGLIQADDAVVTGLDRAFAAFPAPSLDIWY